MSSDVLRELEVVECGDGGAAAFCGHVLQQLGARVTKLTDSAPADPEPADREQLEAWAQQLYFDAGKTIRRGSDDAAFLREAVARGAVVVRGVARSTAMEVARVLDEYESLRQDHPDLVYAGLTPFGLSGPMAGWCGGDMNAQALSGWAAITGDADRPPLSVGYSICEMQHGLAGAAAILAAMVPPAAGELVDVSEVAVLAADIRMYSASYTAYGIEMVRNGRRAPGSTGRYPHTVLPCRDGLVAIICRAELEWNRLVTMLGEPAWATEPRYRDFYAMGTEYPDEVDELLLVWLRRHTKAQIAELATRHRVPIAPVRSVAEALDDAQMNYRNFFVTPREGVRVPGLPAEWKRPGSHPGNVAPPNPGDSLEETWTVR